jgi:AraC-like DNA-binding protein
VDRSPDALYDPRDGDLSLRVTDLDLGTGPAEPPRTNYFSVYWVESGAGTFWADDGLHPFGPNSLLFFVPYQYVRFAPDRPVRGVAVQFHANFLCVETYHAEVGCNGVLFNDPYGVPVLRLDDRTGPEVADLIGRIRRELAGAGLAHAEVLLSYLKVLLVLATRSKLGQGDSAGVAAGRRPPVLDQLVDLIEANYRTLHAPADYAGLLHTSPKALGRLVREHLGKTLTALIRDRVLKHAKWQLLHTLRPVKEVARELGYDDELYFSRLFRKATGYSPTFFREFETAIRGGSNLSISSAGASILPAPAPGQNANEPACEPRKPGPRRRAASG